METKYYTPEIEEFHIGFEYQTYMMTTGGFVIMDMTNQEFSIVKEPTEHMWFTTTFRFSEKGPLDTPYTLEQIKGFLKEDRVRVKCLDQEDLESLGWSLDQKVNGDYFFIIGNMIEGDYSLYTTDFKTMTITPMIGNKNECSFTGEIKNKSELKRIMKQVQIL